MNTTSASTLRVNGKPEALDAPMVLLDWLAARGIRPEVPGTAVAVNLKLVRRTDWGTVTLQPGDEVEIVTARQGG